MAGKLVLCRHGQSDWNLKNLFTGWTDVDLTEKGIQEAVDAGRLLNELGYEFDIAITSVLKRAIRTLWIMLDEMDRMWIPVIRDWRLNERHYGALQGLNKGETAAKYGDDQVHIWRRSYDIPPPPLENTTTGTRHRTRAMPASITCLAPNRWRRRSSVLSRVGKRSSRRNCVLEKMF